MRRIKSPSRLIRRGFTLVELLVAMALTVFVMVILSDAFVKGLETFSGLKAIGDMQENLRVASSNLRHDLGQDHFDGKRRTSDPTLWSDRPRSGFVAIYHGSAASGTAGAPYSNEGVADGIPSHRATDHILHMLVKRKGNRLENFFSAPVPPLSPLLSVKTDIFGAPADATRREGDVFKSQLAEVAYFLVRTGTTQNAADVTSTTGVVPVYNLYRLELVVVPDSDAVNSAKIPATLLSAYKSVCCYEDPPGSGVLYFPSPSDLVNPAKRAFKPAAVYANSANAAIFANRASLVMSDVISFQVQVSPFIPMQQINPGPGAGPIAVGHFDWPTFKDVSAGATPAYPAAFDTGAAASYKERPTFGFGPADVEAVIKGVSITIRGWDRGNLQARQVSIIQDM